MVQSQYLGMCVLDTPRSQQSVMADNSTTSLLPSSTVDESVVAVIASSEVVDGIASEDGTPSVVEAKLVKASEYKQNGALTCAKKLSDWYMWSVPVFQQ